MDFIKKAATLILEFFTGGFILLIFVFIMTAKLKSCFWSQEIEEQLKFKAVANEGIDIRQFKRLFNLIYSSIPINSQKKSPKINFYTGTNTNAYYHSTYSYVFHESFTKLNEDIQAGIIAHEIAHELLYHHKKIVEYEEFTGFVSKNLAIGQDPIVKEEANNIALELTSPSHSKNQEFEADLLAVNILQEYGYENPKGIILNALNHFKNILPAPNSNFSNTHPGIEERIEAITTMNNRYKF